MTIKTITQNDNIWNDVKEYAENCSWRAGKALAREMQRNSFEDWERVIIAVDGGKICGYCTVQKNDCIKNVPYTPYISFVFVGEEYRGNRLSQKLIEYAIEYLRFVGFEKVYLVSDHENLYEKYGFVVIDRKIAPWGEEEKIYMQKFNGY